MLPRLKLLLALGLGTLTAKITRPSERLEGTALTMLRYGPVEVVKGSLVISWAWAGNGAPAVTSRVNVRSR
jgi:hypothetical protein